MASIAQSKKKQLISWLVLLVLMAITARLLLRDRELPQLAELIRQVRWPFLLVGVGTMMLFFLCQGLCQRILLKTFHYRLPLARCCSYALIDFYFSAREGLPSLCSTRMAGSK